MKQLLVIARFEVLDRDNDGGVDLLIEIHGGRTVYALAKNELSWLARFLKMTMFFSSTTKWAVELRSAGGMVIHSWWVQTGPDGQVDEKRLGTMSVWDLYQVLATFVERIPKVGGR